MKSISSRESKGAVKDHASKLQLIASAINSIADKCVACNGSISAEYIESYLRAFQLEQLENMMKSNEKIAIFCCSCIQKVGGPAIQPQPIPHIQPQPQYYTGTSTGSTTIPTYTMNTPPRIEMRDLTAFIRVGEAKQLQINCKVDYLTIHNRGDQIEVQLQYEY